MCGIVGYTGNEQAKEILLKGLEKLEYRGYDSAGIALVHEEGIYICKEEGRIAALREKADEQVSACAGIGHTRWATHGPPSQANAHPHQSVGGRFSIVHNGVIENYKQIKEELLSDVSFASDTDTEVIVHCIHYFSGQGHTTEEALRQTLSLLEGSYALSLIDQEEPGTIYVGKNKSPLLVGKGDGFNAVASDAIALLQVTDQFVELMDQEMVIVTPEQAVIKNVRGEEVQREPFQAEIDATDTEKGLYDHYMMKEMDEQPSVIRNILANYQSQAGELSVDDKIIEALTASDRIYIIACGTSYHAGLSGKRMIEQLAGLHVETHIASEFLYDPPLLTEKPLFIFISQSGETADSRGVLVEAKKLGHRTLAITNVPGSTLSREADFALYTHAGPEISVASTKAYTAQLAVLSILACAAGKAAGKQVDFQPYQELSIAANAIEAVMNQKEAVEELMWNYLAVSRNCFFIGRGADYPVCTEGALKLKEISYIQAEGFAGGELKHGTIALIEDHTPVIAVTTQAKTDGSIRSNVQEVKARGARVCTVSMEGLEQEGDQFVLPRVHELLTPMVSVIPLQLLAYYAALHRKCDIDKPRNLAKSVTVE